MILLPLALLTVPMRVTVVRTPYEYASPEWYRWTLREVKIRCPQLHVTRQMLEDGVRLTRRLRRKR